MRSSINLALMTCIGLLIGMGSQARATLVTTTITFERAWTDRTITILQPVPDLNNVPNNIVMEFTAWGSANALTGTQTGIGGFDLDLVPTDPAGVTAPGGPTNPAVVSTATWNGLLTGDQPPDVNDLIDLVGLINPTTAIATSRDTYGVATPILLSTFFLDIGDPAAAVVTGTGANPVSLTLATGTTAGGVPITMFDSATSLLVDNSITTSHTALAFTVVPEPSAFKFVLCPLIGALVWQLTRRWKKK